MEHHERARYLRRIFIVWLLLTGPTNFFGRTVTGRPLPHNHNPQDIFNRAQQEADKLSHPTTIHPHCPATLDPSWSRLGNYYYNRLQNEPTAFYNGLNACHLNQGHLAIPYTELEWKILLTLAVTNVNDYFIGVYLPQNLPLDTSCSKEECDRYLRLANGAPFQWQPWMGRVFDRWPNQPRCYRTTARGPYALKKAMSTNCHRPYPIICQTTCPPDGPPIVPPPLQHDPGHHRFQRQKEPSINESTLNFLAAQPMNHSQLNPWSQSNLAIDLPDDLPPTKDPKDVVAYDCTDPLDITPYQMDLHHKTCAVPARPQSQRNTTYLLLQRADAVRITTRQCKVTETIIPFYCGYMSHNIFVFPFFRMNEKVDISPRECEDMWDTLTWTDNKGGVHHLQANATNSIYYLKAGKSYIRDGTLDCEGEEYTLGNKTHHSIVVPVSRKIQLFSQPAAVDEQGIVHVLRPDLLLTCPVNTEKCLTGSAGTFIWTMPSPSTACRFHRIRTVTGITVTDQFGVDVFMSTDDSLIRLLLTTTTSKCGHVVFSTNYDKLFLTSDLQAHTFFKPLHPAEFSAYTYANQQDGWLFGFLTQYIRKEFQAVHYHACQQRINEKQLSYDSILAEQHGSTDGDTAHLLNGYFVTVQGETWYRHRCRRITAKAVSLPECYSALPVKLTEDDERRYRYYHKLNGTLQLFVEPHSRRLTRRGISTECSKVFPSLYRGLNGNWLSVLPDIHPIAPPDLLASNDFDALATNDPRDFNFDKGGIYTADDIQSMEKQLHQQRARLDVGYSMGRAAQDTSWTSSNSGSSSFSQQLFAPLAGILDFNPISFLWCLLEGWMFIVNFCAALYWSIYIWFWFHRCSSRPMQPGHNLLQHAWYAAFPFTQATQNTPAPVVSTPTSPPIAPGATSSRTEATAPKPLQEVQPLLTPPTVTNYTGAEGNLPRSPHQALQQEVTHHTHALAQLAIPEREYPPNQGIYNVSYAEITRTPLPNSPRPKPKPFRDDAQIYLTMKRRPVRRHSTRVQQNNQHYAVPRPLTHKPSLPKKPAFVPLGLPQSPRQHWKNHRRSKSYTPQYYLDDVVHANSPKNDFPPLPHTSSPQTSHQSLPQLLDKLNSTSPPNTYLKAESPSPINPPSPTDCGTIGTSPGSSNEKLSTNNTFPDLIQQEEERVQDGFDLLLAALPAAPPTQQAGRALYSALNQDIRASKATFTKTSGHTDGDITNFDNLIINYRKRLNQLISRYY